MKFSEQWLREWVNPALDTQALCDQLSMAGLEVDEVTAAAPEFDQVIVAKILSVGPHPDADKLRICLVATNDTETVQIVCGAKNAAVDMKVPLACVGAVLPGGLKIKPAKLRGVESFGMLCSAVEIGLAEQADGLMALPADAPVGVQIRDYLNLNDKIIDIDLTPNRGDCLSIAGVAREVAALNEIQVTAVEMPEVDIAHDERLTVGIVDEVDCSRYVGRIIKGINPDAVTPMWLAERLRRAGLRSIHPVVDVTNLVMLELGQPMHAFDLARLNGGLQVRRAVAGEALEALSGDALVLSPLDLVIADEHAPVALAGVMGGQLSSVSEGTVDIFLESACFNPLAVAGTGRRHKLHTDSLHRFERGVDPQLQASALERASDLILQLAGGRAGPVVTAGVGKAAPKAIKLRKARITRLLGFDVPSAQVESILASLSMQVESLGAEEWRVTAPSFRYDIEIEADLIEEIVRIHGYDKLPERPQQVALPAMQASETQLPVTRLREAMIHRGYQEVITYSFVDPDKQQALVPGYTGIDLDNPIARQLGQMRTTLWCGLLEALHHNIQRQQSRVRMFEVGMRFRAEGNEIVQRRVLSGLVFGATFSEQWSNKAQAADFYTVKSDIEALLSIGGEQRNVRFDAAEHDALHPGVCAEIFIDNISAGYLGALHPKHLKLFDIPSSPYVFELSLDALCHARVPSYERLSEYPAMRRDLALLMAESVTATALLDCVLSAGETLLKNAFVFDVYRGEGLPSGCKSVALGLNFQDKSRTLTEREVDEAVTRVQERLSQELDANIRG